MAKFFLFKPIGKTPEVAKEYQKNNNHINKICLYIV